MDRLAQSPLTMCTLKVTLAAGTTSTLSSTGTIYYCIRGKAYTKAALSNTTTPTTDAVTAAAFNPVGKNTGCIFIIGLNAAGTLLAAQSTIVALDTSGKFITAPPIPPLLDDFCPIGYEIIQAGSTANAVATGWVFGTNNQASVTGITYTLVDLMTLPDRVQAS